MQSSISGQVAFSVAELFFAFISTGLICAVVFHVWLLLRRRVRAVVVLKRFSKAALWLAALGFALFLLCWGFNYERLPVAVNLGLPQRSGTADELAMICRTVFSQVNANYAASGAPVTGDAAGSRLPYPRTELFRLLAASYAGQARFLRIPPSPASAPKPVYSSRVMTWLGITGIYAPLTGEANFNAGPPDCELPFTIAHEMAHQYGFAREDEANFVAFVVCVNSEDAYVRYSGYLNAMGVVGQLARVAPARVAEVFNANSLAAGPRNDLRAVRMFWTRNQSAASRAGLMVNHVYLKANQVRSGVRSYMDSISLIVAYYLLRPPDQQVLVVPPSGGILDS